MGAGAPYGSTIAEHFRRPRNYGALPNANASAEGVNPLCGDRVRVALLLDGAVCITDARFTANACAICVAAASLLTERLRGMTSDDASQLSDDDALALVGAGVPAARRRCATLPLEAVRRALASIT
jgi:nitrogen fixation protein NifU and related proteins